MFHKIGGNMENYRWNGDIHKKNRIYGKDQIEIYNCKMQSLKLWTHYMILRGD